jgi:hypothetical protein
MVLDQVSSILSMFSLQLEVIDVQPGFITSPQATFKNRKQRF